MEIPVVKEVWKLMVGTKGEKGCAWKKKVIFESFFEKIIDSDKFRTK